MNKDFVPYQQSLDMKSIGFDEPCLMYYDYSWTLVESGVYECKAPLYQQAFRWFREKYVLDSIVQPTYSTKYQYRVFNVETKSKVQVYGDYMGKEFKTYEEAELECLKKLIEITKKK